MAKNVMMNALGGRIVLAIKEKVKAKFPEKKKYNDSSDDEDIIMADKDDEPYAKDTGLDILEVA